jgi:hypothetical protein
MMGMTLLSLGRLAELTDGGLDALRCPINGGRGSCKTDALSKSHTTGQPCFQSHHFSTGLPTDHYRNQRGYTCCRPELVPILD